jgi:hypothetical protein
MEWDLSGVWQDDDGRFWLDVQTEVDDNSHEELHCPQGVPGDRLYIKEGIIVYEDALEVTQLSGYYMDGYRVTKPDEKRLTAIFMPKRMARTWLELTDVRVERLQDISEEDAIAEGIGDWTAIGGWNAETAVEAYHKLWDSINKKKHPWTNNDWVWVLTFREVPA